MKLAPKAVVFCILIGLVATTAFAGNALKLEYKFAPGQTMRYRVKEKSSCNRKVGPMDMNSVWDGVLCLKVNKILANGDAEISASYESGTVRMQGVTHKIKPGEISPVTMVVSRQGAIRNLEELNTSGNGVVGVTNTSSEGSADSTEGITNSSQSVRRDVTVCVLGAMWQEFPARKLQPRDTWRHDVMSPVGTGTEPAKSRLESINGSLNGSRVATIIRTVDEKSPAMAGGFLEDQGIKSAAVKETTKTLFAPRDGRVQRVNSNSRVTMRGVPVDLENGSEEKRDLTMYQSIEVSLIPAAGG